MDAFWSQETSRVSRKFIDSAKALSIRRPVPIIVANKFRDRVGMGCAIHNLEASRRKEKCKDQIQWYSMRRTPTWYKNAWEAGAGSLEAGAIYSENYKNVYESTAPTASICFSIFMMGAKRRMGVVRRQDEALTVDQLLLIGEISKEDW